MTPHIAVISWLFVSINAARTLAYLPQILKVIASRDGAPSVSLLTWGYFLLSHLSGGFYSLDVVHDSKLAGVFFGNALACGVLVACVLVKRRQFRGACMAGWTARRRIRASATSAAMPHDHERAVLAPSPWPLDAAQPHRHRADVPVLGR